MPMPGIQILTYWSGSITILKGTKNHMTTWSDSTRTSARGKPQRKSRCTHKIRKGTNWNGTYNSDVVYKRRLTWGMYPCAICNGAREYMVAAKEWLVPATLKHTMGHQPDQGQNWWSLVTISTIMDSLNDRVYNSHLPQQYSCHFHPTRTM